MQYVKRVLDGYIILAGKGMIGEGISESEYNSIQSIILNRPSPPNGYTYKLRADTLEWELVELPPVEPEPIDEETALIRYANTLTGENDTTLIEAAETMCIKLSKEE